MSELSPAQSQDLKSIVPGKEHTVQEGTPAARQAPERSGDTSQRTAVYTGNKGDSANRKRAFQNSSVVADHNGTSDSGPHSSEAKRVKHEAPSSRAPAEEEEEEEDEDVSVDEEDAGDDDSSLREAGGGLIALQTGRRVDARSRMEAKVREAVIGFKERQGGVVREVEGELAAAARQADEDQETAQKSRNRVNQADVAVKRAEEAAKMARKARRKLEEAAREAEERAYLSVSASKEAGERLAEVVDLQRREKEAMLGMLVVQKKVMLMALKELQDVARELGVTDPDNSMNPDIVLTAMENKVKKINSIWLRYTMERRKLTEVMSSMR